MSVLVPFLAMVLGAVTVVTTTYLLTSDVVMRLWNGLTAPDPEMERRMKTVTVEFSPDAFPVLQAPGENDAGTVSASSASAGVTSTEALVVVAPYASRVIELSDESGEQHLWLCTLCLN